MSQASMPVLASLVGAFLAVVGAGAWATCVDAALLGIADLDSGAGFTSDPGAGAARHTTCIFLRFDCLPFWCLAGKVVSARPRVRRIQQRGLCAAPRALRKMSAKRAKPAAADFWVSSIPTLPDLSTKFSVYAGDLPARSPAHDEEHAHLYFMLHKAKHPPP